MKKYGMRDLDDGSLAIFRIVNDDEENLFIYIMFIMDIIIMDLILKKMDEKL